MANYKPVYKPNLCKVVSQFMHDPTHHEMVSIWTFFGWVNASTSIGHPDERDEQEDGFEINSRFWDGFDSGKSLLLLCCDGHTGQKTVKKILAKLGKLFFRKLQDEDPSTLKEEVIKNALIQAFLELDKFLMERKEVSGACVALTFLIWEKDDNGKEVPVVYSANCGDCRTILIKKDGTVQQLSTEHSAKSASAEELERIKTDGGYLEKGDDRMWCSRVGIIPTRAFGDYSPQKEKKFAGLTAKPSVSSPIVLETGDTIVLMSDGVTSVMSNDNVKDFCAKSDAKDLGTGLVQEAIARGSSDNCTAIVLRVDDSS